jgi:hypothetical protein
VVPGDRVDVAARAHAQHRTVRDQRQRLISSARHKTLDVDDIDERIRLTRMMNKRAKHDLELPYGTYALKAQLARDAQHPPPDDRPPDGDDDRPF